MRRLGLFLLFLFAGGIVVWASPGGQANLYELFLLQTRNDLEIVADQVYGIGVRPPSWTFNLDITTQTFVGDMWYDHEIVAEQVFGEGVRADGWFGATTFDPTLLVRNIRHDLELSADAIFGTSTRPADWNGAEPIYRCDRTVQNLIRILDTVFNVQDNTLESTANYCEALRFELSGELLEPVLSELDSFSSTNISTNTLAVRGDLERLANELLGVNIRPGAWVGNVDENSPTLAADISADLETLAGIALEGGARPSGWSRFVPGAPAVSFLNLRYNLELLSDTELGAGNRPTGWQGTNPGLRCDPILQSLGYTLTRLYNYQPDTAQGESPEYCAYLDLTTNNIAENPPAPATGELIENAADDAFSAESLNAFAYLDVSTDLYMGIMPSGTRFRAWYRNYQQSTMMYVTGIDQDFGLFIDRRWTSLDPDIFARLPNLDGVTPLTYCNAGWCNGPGPTPTPTGGSAVERLVYGAETAIPQNETVDEVSQETGKATVSWNYVRVTYLLDRPETDTVQVTLEICQETTQINCEPVVSVFDQALGAQRPVFSQLNGLNVYELPYGYTTNLVIEGTTLLSPDVWISDPTIR